jgi:hypothetical protein
MFWTALLCGVGASLGANVGLLAFLLLSGLVKAMRGPRRDGYMEATLDALRARNEIGEDQATELRRIACAVESKSSQ